MADALAVLGFLSLASAIAWWALGIVPIVRKRFVSPFERSLPIFAFLIGTWAFLDWIFLGLREPSQAALAITISDVRITVITFASFTFLVAAKWISVGHSRLDGLLVLPVVGSLGIIWFGRLTTGAISETWGLQLVRNPGLYELWAAQQVAYALVAILLSIRLYRRWRELPSRIQRQFFWAGTSLVLFLVVWFVIGIISNLAPASNMPWFSALLVVPAVLIGYFALRLSTQDYSDMLRAFSAIRERVTAIYLFYRTGEPLVALASSRNLPIEAEQLESLLSVVGNFVEMSVPGSRGYSVTAMRYENLGIVAVKGEFVIGAAVYDGPAYDALRGELVRALRDLEERHWRNLGSWEDATKVTESTADELSKFLRQPQRTPGPTLRKGPSSKVTPPSR